MELDFGSVCSGIEAASVAWEPIGWRASWFAEIEAFPSQILAHHYPSVPNYGDMTVLATFIRAGLVSAPDILVGGTPCQAFSVAGLRKSLSDDRGQLSLSFIGLANAIDEKRSDDECVVVWENVPGVLNTNDNAFGCFLAGLAGEDAPLEPSGGRWSNAGCVFGPQRAVAWRVLDAQYFGVAQRRRRVFVIASARNGFDPTKVLFEFEGLRRDIAPSRNAGQEIAGTITTGVRRSDGAGSAASLLVSAARMVAFGEYVEDGTASTMKARDYKDATDLISYGIQANIIGRQDHNGGNGLGASAELSPTLTKMDRHGVATFLQDDASPKTAEEIAGTLRSNAGGQGACAAFAQNSRDEVREMPYVGALSAQPGMKQTSYIRSGTAVRRLTPTECERLQGFPDGYTLIRVKNGLAADTPRYKALGNSMAVPVMRWIGERINLHLEGKL